MSRRSKPVRALRDVLRYDNERVVDDFIASHGLDRAEGESLFRELLKLLWLAAARELPSSFPIVLHALWRELVVDTAEYERFCARYLGRLVHHDPRVGVAPSLARSDADLDAAISLVYTTLGRDTAVLWFDTLVAKYPPDLFGGRGWADYFAATKDKRPSKDLQGALRRFDLRPLARSRFAIDLGCGSGRDTNELLKRGWRVLAIDAEPAALGTLLESVAPDTREALSLRCARFERLERLPRCDLVNASLSLPFCAPDSFARVWSLVVGSIRRGGRFAGRLLGEADDWAPSPSMTFHSLARVRELLADFRIERLKERDWVGPAAAGGTKHWHVISVIAKRT